MSSEYFVDVVSNASMETYPDNTISKFTNRLATPLHLDGEWSVAVQEVFYPLSHKPIKRSINYFISYRGRRPTVSIDFDYQENDDVEGMLKKLNKSIADSHLQIGLSGINVQKDFKPPELVLITEGEPTKQKKKVVIKAGRIPDVDKGVYPIFSDHTFIRALGFDNNTFASEMQRAVAESEEEIKAPNQPDLGPKSHLMFIYSDIIHAHLLGDISARVLRVVPLNREPSDKLGHMTFTSPYYYPVRSNKIEDVSIVLCDETGNQIRFKTGRVFLSLHFKKTV
uniref:Uncharacterized protein n=1 Tax=Tetranychus urticae TaxID=32264 RepID=A0A158P508_TETUR